MLSTQDSPEIEVRPGVFKRDNKFTRYECQDCKIPSPLIFKVHQELWDGTGLTGIICLECFEKKLGRSMTIDDFTTTGYANEHIHFGYKLAKKEISHDQRS